MLAAALKEPDPVFIFEHFTLYGAEGEVDESTGAIDIRKAVVRRAGKDVSLITHGGSLGKTLKVAEQLAAGGIDAEVIDLRALRPLDLPTILASVGKTRRAVIVDEAWYTGSLAAEVSARIMEGAFYELDAPVARVCSADVPIPYAMHLEDGRMRQFRPDRQARMRQAISAAMTRSKREIPHYYLSTTIDLHTATTWLTERNAARSVTERLLPGVLFVKAVALALREVPELNALWAGDQAVRSEAIHVGVAISLRSGGFVAPAIHNADRKTLDELMGDLRDLVSRARVGILRSSELSEPTITVTSLGDQGADTVFGVIYPPQVAIVGFGRIVARPWVVGGQVMPRLVVTATLSADHRVSDGHRGGLFLATIDRLLQEPAKL